MPGTRCDAIQTNQVGGNQVLPKRVTMAYNALGQRTQIARFQSTGTANPVATTNFTYDTANRLVRRHDAVVLSYTPVTYWVYDEGTNPLLEYFGGNPLIQHRYVWSDNVDDLLADEQNPGLSSRNTLWALSDHLGSIRDIADTNESTGTTSIANHRRYDSFGRRVWETNDAVDLVFGYTGKLFDETTRLQNNLNRWYDSSTGRWISQDPIGFAAGDANLYRYTGNSPTNRTDPSGLDWWESEQEGERDWNSMGGWNPWGWNFPFGQQQLLFYAGGGWSAANRSIELERQHRAMLRLRSQSAGWNGDVQSVIRSYAPSQSEVDGMMGYADAGIQANASLLGGGLIGTTIRSGIIRGGSKSRVVFDGMEVRGVRNLSHVDESTLRAMSKKGFTAKDVNGNTLHLHHLEQNPAGPTVEIPDFRHKIGNEIQHPFGNTPGVGLSAEQRAVFDAWRLGYWKARADEELTRRGLAP